MGCEDGGSISLSCGEWGFVCLYQKDRVKVDVGKGVDA